MDKGTISSIITAVVSGVIIALQGVGIKEATDNGRSINEAHRDITAETSEMTDILNTVHELQKKQLESYNDAIQRIERIQAESDARLKRIEAAIGPPKAP